ncbi:hypothetical protein SALBM217S_05920 [Streptomyces griseoloalbus]
MARTPRCGRNGRRDVTQTTADVLTGGCTRSRTIVLMATEDAVREALATVNDPEINRPITELGMVKSVEIGADGAVAVTVYLTVSGCPMRDTITQRVTDAVSRVEGVTRVDVTLDVMSDEQRGCRLLRHVHPAAGGGGRAGDGSLSRPWTESATSAISFFRSKPLRISFSPRSSLSSCLRMNVLGSRSSTRSP